MCQKKIICHGLRTGPNVYSPEGIALFFKVLAEVRKTFKVDLGNEELSGDRVKDYKNVLWTLKSEATEQEFRCHPYSWVHAALLDCAQRDHYYRYSKKWED